MPPYRLGLIHYTNVAPLTHSLEQGPNWSLETGYPTEMNRALLEGRVDLANISAVEFVRHADVLSALPDFSVSVLGPVYSVNLFHTCSWKQLQGQKIALTSQSATSVALLNVLLEQSGIQATLELAEGNAFDLLERGYAAVLRIGDDALKEWYTLAGPLGDYGTMINLPHCKNGITVTDLAMSWYEHTKMPFVFAVWAYRKDRPPPLEVQHAMRVARRYGVGHLEQIAAQHALALELPERIVQHYLWNFRYHLEKPDKDGLERFAALAVPDHAPLEFAKIPL